MGKPVIAAVNGPAAGAGTGLAAACDLRLAASSAVFRTSFAGVGLSADTGLSFTLPRLVGTGRAMRMLLLDEPVAADEALAIGLVDPVVDDAELPAAVAALAGRLADGPTGRTDDLGLGAPRRRGHADAALDFEDRAQAACFAGADHREAIERVRREACADVHRELNDSARSVAGAVTYPEPVGPMGELGALFNPGMRHEIAERQAKAIRREEEGNARDGDLRIDLASGVAVISVPEGDRSAAPVHRRPRRRGPLRRRRGRAARCCLLGRIVAQWIVRVSCYSARPPCWAPGGIAGHRAARGWTTCSCRSAAQNRPGRRPRLTGCQPVARQQSATWSSTIPVACIIA